MSTDDTPLFSDEQIAIGARLLRKVLPQARRDADQITARGTSPLAEATTPYLREDNLRALLIYQTHYDGWLADVLLHHVPPGVSNVLGTPVSRPMPSYDEALKQGIGIISFILNQAKQPAKAAPPAFLYYNASFDLVPDLLQLLSDNGARYESVSAAHDRLRQVTLDVFPDRRRPTFERIQALSLDDIRALASVFHMAALTGVMRYPAVEPGIPGEERDETERGTDSPA